MHIQPTSPKDNKARPMPMVRAVLSWIAENDRQFRATQSRINHYADRF